TPLPRTLREIIAQDLLPAVAAELARGTLPLLPAASLHFLPPIPDPRKIICIGLNYRDHATEQGAPIPKEPVVFSKFPTALSGHEHPIQLPRVSQEVDYEAELVVVLGRAGRDIPTELALEHVAGYMVGHDVSARDWQKKKDGKQWLLGKSFDGFAPTGPWFVTRDEVPDPHALPIRLRLNGQIMQESNTAQLIFSVPYLINYVSQVCTLEPGDLLFTGTPSGVGFARTPPVFLQGGDVVEVEIEGLGLLRNSVRA
ncbi:MAG TPA: fumarylacetoacetate hydrolase family protein, partial [Gemmatales bacterium]|nr:fumarylacetoacetate hydrolase family protein [Gemmatales bacterium]